MLTEVLAIRVLSFYGAPIPSQCCRTSCQNKKSNVNVSTHVTTTALRGTSDMSVRQKQHCMRMHQRCFPETLKSKSYLPYRADRHFSDVASSRGEAKLQLLA